MVPEDGRERLVWPSPFDALVDEIERRRGRRVCVLATGDPMHYGVGVTLAGRIPPRDMTIVPAPSAFALACARLGWSRAEVETLSLHGRPLSLVLPALQPGAKLLLLSHDGRTPAQLAALLTGRGFGASRITVLERMGAANERRHDGTAEGWSAAEVADFSTVALECVAEPEAVVLPRVPGLPDAAYRNDGQLTKREVRAVTLAALGPAPGQLLWDVGAGAGSVAIEWMRHHPRCRAVALERRKDRIALIADNASALGTPGLQIVEGEAPGALEGLERPSAVFIGGVQSPGTVEACWRALEPGGRLVANAVTVEGEQALARWHAELGGELTRIAISRAEALGPYTAWRPLRPVTQLRASQR